MKILVTGATGLVGINLVRRLVTDGHQVRILVRQQSKMWPFDELQVDKCVGDIKELVSVREAVDGMEAVFHVAGYVNISPFVRIQAKLINVGGTDNVIEACRDAKVKRLIHTSSIVAIGYGSKDKPATEQSEWNLASLHNPYSDTKREAEEHVLQAAHTGALDAVVLNPGYILGPWDIKPRSGLMMLAVAHGKMKFYPQGGIAIAPVDAVVEAFIQALHIGCSGERYILGGENLTYREILTLMAKVTGVKGPRIPLIRTATWPLGIMGDCLGSIWPRRFANMNSNVLRIRGIGHYVNSDKARRELNYNPGPAKQAIESAYRWFVENEYIKTNNSFD